VITGSTALVRNVKQRNVEERVGVNMVKRQEKERIAYMLYDKRKHGPLKKLKGGQCG
jgi:hypothetical protein